MRKKNKIYKTIIIIFGAVFLISGCGKADKAYDNGMDYIESKEYKKALECFDNAIEKNDEKAEYYIASGMAYNYLGKYQDAIKRFSKAFQSSENSISNTNNKQLYYGEAISYYGMKKYDNVLEDCKKALDIKQVDNLNDKIYYLMAAAYHSKGDYENAKKIYDSLIKSDEKDTKAYLARAQLHIDKNEYDEALKYFTRAMDTDENCEDAYFGLYRVYNFQNDRESATNILNKFIDMSSSDEKKAVATGKAYYYLEEYDDALTFFDKAEKNGEEDAVYYKGLIYMMKGDNESALKQYMAYESKDIPDKNNDVYNELAKCFMQSDDYKQALVYVKKGLAKGTTSVEKALLKKQVILYEKMGKYKIALRCARKYVSAYPADKDMKKELTFIKTRI